MEGSRGHPSLFSPPMAADLSFNSSGRVFSPMDTSRAQDQKSTTTPRRRLSLDVDENAQSPQNFEQDAGYGGSQGSSGSCSSLEAYLGGGLEWPGEVDTRSPLAEIRPSSMNTAAVPQRRTLLARRLKRHISASPAISEDKENLDYKESSVSPIPIKLPHPLSLRPSSLPALSPLTQDKKSKSLLKMINSPLERMSLMSPTPTPPIHHPSHRPASTSSTVSDGYFSEVFENEMEEGSSTPLPEALSTLLNAPLLTHSPSTTFVNKPQRSNSGGLVCPTPVRPSLFPRSDSCFHPLLGRRRGSLKRSSPSSELAHLPQRKRPPLPVFTSSNSNSSPPKRPLKGVTLLRSQSCSMTAGETSFSPRSPGDDGEPIGDFSKPYALPLVKGNVADLKCIAPETLSALMKGEYSGTVDEFTIIDCRYPYEYHGGHIQGAVNLWNKDLLVERFFKNLHHPSDNKRCIFVYHCEFSSKRGPDMSRFMRKMDREKNGMAFPKLYYPEIYLLDKGYKNFYEKHPELCEPNGYKTMLDENHKEELKRFKQRSKSWNGESNSRRRQSFCRPRRATVFDTSSAFQSTNSSPSH